MGAPTSETLAVTYNTRYKEHTQVNRNNHSNSGYSNHILNTGYKYGTISDTIRVDIIRTEKKGKHLNTLEKYHNYLSKKDNLQINETHIDTFNPILETLYELRNKKQHVQPQNHVVACRPIARQRPRNKQLDNRRY
jgi:precorrin-6B methylase 2